MLRRLLRLTVPLAATLGLAAPSCDAAPMTADASLPAAIQAYFQQQFPGDAYQVRVTLLSEAEQWPHCLQPQISQLASPRRWGRLSVLVQCPEARRYLQTEVQVTGRYPVTVKALNRGQNLSATQFRLTRGRLDTLPPGTILDLSRLEGATTLRSIGAGQPITAGMVRRTWVIRAGQQVQILAQGDGFNVSSEGRAMNNAALADVVRARTASGQVISGKASGPGTLTVTL
ncbi:flagella basal body P-ring formation protein FlgA [Edwardsiella hoshinae]|uniref:Flagella basal body P-ring formation protein FlgA n=1 Tax=Edwardsiella hoshinae TaxID=93378 RepID=A0ABM6EK83_9GAMM|nr:flagellar basal body P-ring formation chaperone FlgA [Edwardsiella hoshinae]AOV97364.1 flagella basal body P-ring formation protein FlgA [Edwardsiella hoshinae]